MVHKIGLHFQSKGILFNRFKCFLSPLLVRLGGKVFVSWEAVLLQLRAIPWIML